MEPCCWSTYSKHRDAQATLDIIDKLDVDGERLSDEEIAQRFGYEDEFSTGTITRWQKFRCRLWAIFDEPYSSTMAKFIASISIIFICLSVLCFCLKTNYSLTNKDAEYFHSNITRQKKGEEGKKLYYVFYYIEHACNAWFTLEIIIRCLVGTLDEYIIFL